MGRQSIPKFYKCDREIHRVRVRRRMHIYKQQLSINWCMRTSNLLDYAKYTTNDAFPFKDSDKSIQNHNVKKIVTLNLSLVSTIGVYSLLLKRKRRVLIKKHSKPSNSWQPFSVLQMLEATPGGTMEQNRILFSFLLQFIPRLTG